MAQLQIVIVTPETTTLDKMVDGVTVPLIDGSAGILPGHAAMIGRLGPGELRVHSGTAMESFYVDGGFVQVESDVVSVLTGRSMPASELDSAAIQKALQAAESLESSTVELAQIKEKAVSQARAQLRMVQR